MRKALAVSFAAHGALFFAFVPLAHRAARPPEAELAPPKDSWSGTTAELPFAGGPAGPLVDVSVEVKPAPAAPALPAAPDPAPVPAVPPSPPSQQAPPAPKSTADAADAPRPKPRPAPPRVDRPAPPREPAKEPREQADRPAPPPSPKRARAVAGSAEPGSAPGAAATGSFGAEGPASVRDLGRAFTRAIPPACDADPAWATLPAGDAGKLEVAIHVDADGHIKGFEPRGKVQPQALVNVLRRTVPMLQAGTFALREGGTSEGTEILELSARVSDAEGEEDGAPNKLAFEYARGRGKARFTQSNGRRVEIGLRVVRVEAER
ncbi:MAG: hypothetical protein QM820_37495 [Minicystis sp.]